MKRLILSAAVYLLVIDLSAVNAIETFQNDRTSAPQHHPVIIAGFFDGIRNTVDKVKNTIEGLRNTVDEVKQINNDLTGKDTQSSSTNQPTNTTSTTEEGKKFETNRKCNADESQTGDGEQVICTSHGPQPLSIELSNKMSSHGFHNLYIGAKGQGSFEVKKEPTRIKFSLGDDKNVNLENISKIFITYYFTQESFEKYLTQIDIPKMSLIEYDPAMRRVVVNSQGNEKLASLVLEDIPANVLVDSQEGHRFRQKTDEAVKSALSR